MKKLEIPELNNRELLARLYEKYTCREIGERLGCCGETVSRRLASLGIRPRQGAASSVKTRIEKTEVLIRRVLHGWPKEVQAMILQAVVKELGGHDGPAACPICLRVGCHEGWCSVSQKERN